MKDAAIFLARTADLIAQARFLRLVTEEGGVFGECSTPAHNKLTRELAVTVNYALPYEQAARIRDFDNAEEVRRGLLATSAWLQEIALRLYGGAIPASKSAFKLARGEGFLRKATDFLWSKEFEAARERIHAMSSPAHPDYVRGIELAYVTDVLVGIHQFVVAKNSLAFGVEHEGLSRVITFALEQASGYWSGGYIMDLLVHDRMTLAEKNSVIALRLSKSWVSTKLLYSDAFTPGDVARLANEDFDNHYFLLDKCDANQCAA